MDERVVLRTFLTRVEAEAARALLAGSGVEAFTTGDDCGAVDPALSFGRGVQLLVARDDEAAAEEVLAAELPKDDEADLASLAEHLMLPMSERYSAPALRSLFEARRLAFVHGASTIGTTHLLAAILRHHDWGTTRLLTKAGVDVGALRRSLGGPPAAEPQEKREIPFDDAVKKVLALAGEAAGTPGEATIQSAHLLQGLLLVEQESGGGPLIAHGATLDALRSK
ncbi:MAG TPA: Clp protease N-terminal domain-containing protein [Candidatus Polarisedimenticolaceae bacterium]|nr:Clp protease N-terminal domain-containing protein [Candidatus Polarisedimenticolaceae bacterium]